jgi:hypothetical protein
VKLYTNKLTMSDLHRALPNGLTLLDRDMGGKHDPELIDGPRSRRFINVRLASWEPRGKGMNYRLTTGGQGSWSCHAWNATWHEHGIWMTRLFDMDPWLRIVGLHTWENRMDFHERTHGEFEQYREHACGDANCEVCGSVLVTA